MQERRSKMQRLGVMLWWLGGLCWGLALLAVMVIGPVTTAAISLVAAGGGCLSAATLIALVCDRHEQKGRKE